MKLWTVTYIDPEGNEAQESVYAATAESAKAALMVAEPEEIKSVIGVELSKEEES